MTVTVTVHNTHTSAACDPSGEQDYVVLLTWLSVIAPQLISTPHLAVWVLLYVIAIVLDT